MPIQANLKPRRLCAVLLICSFIVAVNKTLKLRQPAPHLTDTFFVLNDSFDCDSETADLGSVASVYWTVFAGRREYLQLQEEYWVRLHQQGLVTEVHLWDFVHKGKNVPQSEMEPNRRWINEKAKQYDFVKVLTEPQDPSCWPRQECFGSYYEYYGSHTKPNDVIVKVDDDTLFVNISEFKCFVKFVHESRDTFLVSANIVNNAVIAHMQQSLGILPRSVGDFEYPEGGLGLYSSLYHSPEKAYSIHEYFLTHKSDFCQNKLLQIRQRLSINFVAYSQRNAKRVSDIHWLVYRNRWRHYAFRPWWDHDAVDEAALTSYVNSVLREKEVVYMRLVAAHGSKSAQMRRDPELMRRIVRMYARDAAASKR